MNINNVLNKFNDKRIIALDIETTGGSKEVNRIIQLGVVEFDCGKFIREYVKLFGGGHSTRVCLDIHHIQDKDRIGKPSFEMCCGNVAKYLSNSVIIGHNVKSCDMRMINEAMGKTGNIIENYRVIDTYLLSKKIFSFKKHNLETVCQEFKIPFGQHDALGDAKAALLFFDKIVERMKMMEQDYFYID